MLQKTSKKIRKIAFFGDAEAKDTDNHFAEAKETAKLMAEAGYIVVNGGGPGVMLAASLGAKEGGGVVELVILDPKKQPENYEGVDKLNLSMADKIWTTENYPERLNKLIEVADAYVIFKGGTGTISEVGLTWELAKFEYGKHEPLVFVGEEWGEILKSMKDNLDLDKEEKNVYAVVKTPGEVLKVLKSISDN